MSLSELLAAASGSPLLLALLVLGGFGVWAVERLGGVDGPLTRLLRAWQERELRRLRRERAVEEERQRHEDARVAELESEVRWLREQLRRLREGEPPLGPDTEPIPGRDRRNSARRPLPPR